MTTLSSLPNLQNNIMSRAIHIFDPDGEVIIILQCLDNPFAPWDDHEEPPAEEPPAEEPPAEGPVIFNEQLQEEHMKKQFFRIQASAKHLILASPVFKKALTGGWKEGFHLLKNGAVEITTSDWDLEAFLILMNIIHCQPQNLPQETSLELLAKIAVLADYYQCETLLQYFADKWIETLKVNFPTIYSRDSMLWVWVSWAFRRPFEFEKSTLIAISQSGNDITNLGLPIPDIIIHAMNLHRTRAISSIISTLTKLHDAFLDGSHGCSFECCSIMFGALTKHMHSIALLFPQPRNPFIDLNYNELVKAVRAFKSPTWSSHHHYARPHGCRDSSFSSLINIPESAVQGLDLFSMTITNIALRPLPKECENHRDRVGSPVKGLLGPWHSPERQRKIELLKSQNRCQRCRGIC